MINLTDQQILDKTNEVYGQNGFGAVIEWVTEYNHSNRLNQITYEKCEACENKVPQINHECLCCGSKTKTIKPKFYQAVLKEVKGNVLDHVYPYLKGKEQVTMTERMGSEQAECIECGSNEWMLYAKESVAVKQGGKPYMECLGCGQTTHL